MVRIQPKPGIVQNSGNTAKSKYTVSTENRGTSSNATKDVVSRALPQKEVLTIANRSKTPQSILSGLNNFYTNNSNVKGYKGGSGVNMRPAYSAAPNNYNGPSVSNKYTDAMKAAIYTQMAGKAAIGLTNKMGQWLTSKKVDGQDLSKKVNSDNSTGKSSADYRAKVKGKTNEIKSACKSANDLKLDNIKSMSTSNIQAVSQLDIEPKVDLSNITNSLNNIGNIDISDVEKPTQADVDAITGQYDNVSSTYDMVDKALKGSLNDVGIAKFQSNAMSKLDKNDPNYATLRQQIEDQVATMRKAQKELQNILEKCQTAKETLGKLKKELPELIKQRTEFEEKQKNAETKENDHLKDLNDDAKKLITDLATGGNKKATKSYNQIPGMIAKLNAAKNLVGGHTMVEVDKTLLSQVDDTISDLQELRPETNKESSGKATELAQSFNLEVGKPETIGGKTFLVTDDGQLKIGDKVVDQDEFTRVLGEVRTSED